MALAVHSHRASTTRNRASKPVVLLGAAAVVALWHCWRDADCLFVVGTGRPKAPGGVTRRAGFNFDIATSDDHTDLSVQQEDTGLRVSTKHANFDGTYNTVLGNKEVPASGRTYWEVKILKKPTNSWEHIGVAEPSADVTVPLTKNRKGAGWFWGANTQDSMVYLPFPADKDYHESQKKLVEEKMRHMATGRTIKDDVFTSRVNEIVGNNFKEDRHVGSNPDLLPSFKPGTLVGVDVDMDKGSLSFWANGEYLGPVRDLTGKPLDIKGKKLVPALSIYGRKSGNTEQYSVMELRTGMEPPPLP